MQYEIENETFRAKGYTWLVRKARKLEHAQKAVITALAYGCIGAKVTHNGQVYADVIQLDNKGKPKELIGE